MNINSCSVCQREFNSITLEKHNGLCGRCASRSLNAQSIVYTAVPYFPAIPVIPSCKICGKNKKLYRNMCLRCASDKIDELEKQIKQLEDQMQKDRERFVRLIVISKQANQ